MESEVFFDNPEFSDVNLQLVEDGTNKTRVIRSHKVILSKESEFFHRLFQEGFRENITGVYALSVPSIEIAAGLIKWMYNKEPFIPAEMYDQAAAWLIVNPEETPYPGVRGTFQFRGESYNDKPTTPWKHMITFASITPGSTISTVLFSQFKDGRLLIEIVFRPDSEALRKYLEQYGIPVSNSDMYIRRIQLLTQGSYVDQVKTLTQIVLATNYFQPADIERIRAFVADKFTLD